MGGLGDFGDQAVIAFGAKPEIDEGGKKTGDHAKPGDDVATGRLRDVDRLAELLLQLAGDDVRDTDL